MAIRCHSFITLEREHAQTLSLHHAHSIYFCLVLYFREEIPTLFVNLFFRVGKSVVDISYIYSSVKYLRYESLFEVALLE